jgi:hypothetical protein
MKVEERRVCLEAIVPLHELQNLLKVASEIDATRRVKFDLVVSPSDIYIEYNRHGTVGNTIVSEYGRIIPERPVIPETNLNNVLRVGLRFPIVMGFNLLSKMQKSGTEKVKIQIPCHKLDIACFDPKELFIPTS